MSDSALDRLSQWLQHGTGQWGRGVASDVLALEDRVAALEGNRPATPDSSPAADGEWRHLDPGEVIEDGDEVLLSGQVGWVQMTGQMGFRVTRDEAGMFRRRVNAATPAADGDALRAECERLREENERLRKDRDNWKVCSEINKESAEKLHAKAERLRDRLAAPIDVEEFRPEFEKLVLNGPFSIARDVGGFYESLATCLAWLAVTAFASRLNVAARKEATPGQPTQSATG